MTPQDRLNYARQEKLCFSYLRKGRMTVACRLIEHALWLVVEENTPNFSTSHRQRSRKQEETTSQLTTQPEAPVQNGYIDSAADISCSNVTGAGSRSVLPIVSVWVQAVGGSSFVRTYALFFCTAKTQPDNT